MGKNGALEPDHPGSQSGTVLSFFVSWGSALPVGACFVSTKIEAVVEIK